MAGPDDTPGAGRPGRGRGLLSGRRGLIIGGAAAAGVVVLLMLRSRSSSGSSSSGAPSSTGYTDTGAATPYDYSGYGGSGPDVTTSIDALQNQLDAFTQAETSSLARQSAEIEALQDTEARKRRRGDRDPNRRKRRR